LGRSIVFLHMSLVAVKYDESKERIVEWLCPACFCLFVGLCSVVVSGLSIRLGGGGRGQMKGEGGHGPRLSQGGGCGGG